MSQISKKELEDRCLNEGIPFEDVSVISPRWSESSAYQSGVKSHLLKCDLIVRSDGSAVYLDGCMGIDSMIAANYHINNPFDEDEWEQRVQFLSNEF